MENPSEDEINAQKNFNEVALKTKRMKQKHFFKTGLIIASAMIVIITSAVLFNSNLQNTDSTPLKSNKLPIEGVPYAGFEINTAKDTFLVSSTGSLIEIPKNVFTDSTGNPVQGKVNISYREFHHPAEIILSRIPMTYDSAGTRYHFESAGMFEIDAHQHGKKLRMAAGKSIVVKLASLDSNQTKFNQYYLANVNDKWQFMGKDATWNMPENPVNPVSVQNNKSYVEPKLMNPAKQQFKIYTNMSEFPELSRLNNLVFELSDREKNFKPADADTYWDDIGIERSDVFGEYKVTLIKGTETYQVLTKAVVSSFDSLSQINQYQGASVDNVYYGYGKSRTNLTKKLLGEQTVAQAMMERYRSMVDRYSSVADISENSSSYVYRTFQVSNLGMYNSDCPEMLPEPGLVTARFKYSNGSLIDVATIFLIEHNRNAVFTFYKGDKIHYNPDAANSIVIITQDDEIGLLTKEKFAELKGNVNQFTFAPEFTANNSGKLEQLLKSL
jgi:hypothetical protein